MFNTRWRLQAWGYIWLAAFGALWIMLKLGLPWWLSVTAVGAPAAVTTVVLYRRWGAGSRHRG